MIVHIEVVDVRWQCICLHLQADEVVQFMMQLVELSVHSMISGVDNSLLKVNISAYIIPNTTMKAETLQIMLKENVLAF